MVATSASVAALTPPGPRGWPLLGSLPAYRRDPLGFLSGLARDYGDVSAFRFGPWTVTLLNHPDLIRDVLVTHQRNFAKGAGIELMKPLLGEGLLTSEGEFHLRQRRLAQPAFHRKRIAAYGAAMVEEGARARERWRDGATFDVSREMTRLTLTVVGRTLFGADVEAEVPEIGAALTAFMAWWQQAMLPYSALLRRLPWWSVDRDFQRARARLDATIYRLIRERRAGGVDSGDLLSMLLLARDEEGTGGMTDAQVRDEALTIFLAGHETTANALAWTWYLLARHPACYDRLEREVDRALAGRLPSVGDLPRLPYALQVFKEALRLYPPAPAVVRVALRDSELGGYPIARGTAVLYSPFALHRRPDLFPEPARFDPERFSPAREPLLPRHAYLPFGGGHRTCIGNHFALLEGQLVLAALAGRVRFEPVGTAPVVPQFVVTLLPRGGVPVRVRRRDRSPA